MTKHKPIDRILDQIGSEYESAPQNKATLRAVERRVVELLKIKDDDARIVAKYTKDGTIVISAHVERGSKWALKLRGMGATVVPGDTE